MQIRTTFLAALAALPLLAGGASAHGGWGGEGYGPPRAPMGYDWREREARRDWVEAQRAREWTWHRHQAWKQRERFEAAQRWQGGWGPRW
jgi:hypothetical protein